MQNDILSRLSIKKKQNMKTKKREPVYFEQLNDCNYYGPS